MPIDPSLLPALEKELEYAKNYAPGGQAPNEGRIAAIEEEIAKYRAAENAQEPQVAEPENMSDEPTDYASTDDVDVKREKAVSKRKEAAAKAEAEVETADETSEDLEVT